MVCSVFAHKKSVILRRILNKKIELKLLSGWFGVCVKSLQLYAPYKTILGRRLNFAAMPKLWQLILGPNIQITSHAFQNYNLSSLTMIWLKNVTLLGQVFEGASIKRLHIGKHVKIMGKAFARASVSHLTLEGPEILNTLTLSMDAFTGCDHWYMWCSAYDGNTSRAWWCI